MSNQPQTDKAPSIQEQRNFLLEKLELVKLQNEFYSLTSNIAKNQFEEAKHLHMLAELKAIQKKTKEQDLSPEDDNSQETAEKPE